MSDCNITYSDAAAMDPDEIAEANAALDLKQQQLEKAKGDRK